MALAVADERGHIEARASVQSYVRLNTRPCFFAISLSLMLRFRLTQKTLIKWSACDLQQNGFTNCRTLTDPT